MTMHHGTEAGYRQHYRNRIPYCGPCQRAHADYNRQLVQQKKNVEHGTAEGLAWHARTRKPVCDLCLYYACWHEHETATAVLRGVA